MSGNPFRRVRTGEPLDISAAAWNATMDIVEASRKGTGKQSPGNKKTDATTILVANTTSGFLPRFSVLGLAGPLCTPQQDFDVFANEMVFRGVSPSDSKFAILLADAETGQAVSACVDGVCIAKIKSDDDTVDTCDVIEGETGYLKSGGKIDVLWIEPPGNPEKPRWAIVRLGGGSGAAAAPAAPVLYGTIMEDVPPTDHSDVDYRFGKVSVLGKTYGPTDSNESVNDGNPIVYDYCVCLETSFESDEYLIQNTFVKLTGPYKMDDPDADPESEEPPDQVDFYVAVEIDREYIAEIDSDIYKSTDSTIQVGGHSFKVFGDLIPPDSYIPAGFGVRVRRTTGTTVPRLCVIAGKCPAKIQEEQ